MTWVDTLGGLEYSASQNSMGILQLCNNLVAFNVFYFNIFLYERIIYIFLPKWPTTLNPVKATITIPRQVIIIIEWVGNRFLGFRRWHLRNVQLTFVYLYWINRTYIYTIELYLINIVKYYYFWIIKIHIEIKNCMIKIIKY